MDRPAVFITRTGLFCLLPIGLLLLGLSAYLTLRQSAWIARSLQAEGTIIDMLQFRDAEGTGHVYAPVVRFRTANGQTIEFQSGTRTYPPVYRKGEIVKVVYDGDLPEIAMIRSFVSLWLGPLIAGLVGPVFILVGAAMTILGARVDRILSPPGSIEVKLHVP